MKKEKESFVIFFLYAFNRIMRHQLPFFAVELIKKKTESNLIFSATKIEIYEYGRRMLEYLSYNF